MNVDFSKWVEQGPMIVALTLAVLYFVRREVRTDKKVDSAMKKCEEREQVLASRLQVFEDRQYTDSQSLLKTCANVIGTCTSVIQTNSETFKQLTKTDTDKFKALKPPDLR